MIAEADRLRVVATKGSRGETLIDAGAAAKGGIDAGLMIAKICLGGLGHIDLTPYSGVPDGRFISPCARAIRSSPASPANMPAGRFRMVIFFALGSGPGRALACKEPLFQDLGYKDHADRATLVLESEKPPPPEVVERSRRIAASRPSG